MAPEYPQPSHSLLASKRRRPSPTFRIQRTSPCQRCSPLRSRRSATTRLSLPPQSPYCSRICSSRNNSSCPSQSFLRAKSNHSPLNPTRSRRQAPSTHLTCKRGGTGSMLSHSSLRWYQLLSRRLRRNRKRSNRRRSRNSHSRSRNRKLSLRRRFRHLNSNPSQCRSRSNSHHQRRSSYSRLLLPQSPSSP